MNEATEPRKELSDLEKADCLTGKMMGGIALKKAGFGSGKRRRFVFDDRTCCYHVMSRVAGGDLLFGDTEKEAFRKLMRRMERFSGVEILTYAIMGNHFHLLVRIPEREVFLGKFKKGDRAAREGRVFEHLKLLYSKAYLAQLASELELMKRQKMDVLYEKTIEGYLERLCSLKHFMKELKERFSRWFNKRHDRRGTLWQDRYRSVLVQDGEALQTMAAYIDLNPLRAGLVEDPKDYRWCGYSEAVVGSKRARVGICRVMAAALDSWRRVASGRYRRFLLIEGMERSEDKSVGKHQRTKAKPGFDREAVLKKLKEGASLSRGEVLRCKMKYFSKGKVIGTKDFVERTMAFQQDWFAPGHRSKAQEIPISGSHLYRMR